MENSLNGDSPIKKNKVRSVWSGIELNISLYIPLPFLFHYY
ncbi:hypothetical protein M109_0586 [Bacteroides fragilis str. 3397 N2]|nr:hypothetical protein M109_0586 [Bacteroides fragilis str. 3397 N2]EXZ55409.1 hypothetical protein M108_0576 [Bacteroides fragilis str. 3397 T14]EYA45361.1 hypothetical protein M110_0600 [Bacteroides fragilis str. 3397 N3]